MSFLSTITEIQTFNKSKPTFDTVQNNPHQLSESDSATLVKIVLAVEKHKFARYLKLKINADTHRIWLQYREPATELKLPPIKTNIFRPITEGIMKV